MDPNVRLASRGALWGGWIASLLPSGLLLFGGAMKLVKPPMVVEGFGHLGYPPGLAFGLGITEIACTIVYLVPRTSVLGAILLTGFMGGATATHVRIGESPVFTVGVGVLVWLGLYLRDRRVRALIPLRQGRPRSEGLTAVSRG